jgi:hypothetical protein
LSYNPDTFQPATGTCRAIDRVDLNPGYLPPTDDFTVAVPDGEVPVNEASPSDTKVSSTPEDRAHEAPPPPQAMDISQALLTSEIERRATEMAARRLQELERQQERRDSVEMVYMRYQMAFQLSRLSQSSQNYFLGGDF